MTNVSPADTEWATRNAVDWERLSLQTWQFWAAEYPPGIVDVDACVYLVSDDIYVDIRFESWTQSGPGGGFTYKRVSCYRRGPGSSSARGAEDLERTFHVLLVSAEPRERELPGFRRNPQEIGTFAPS